MPGNVTQGGIGRGTACDLLGHGAGRPDGQVKYAWISLQFLSCAAQASDGQVRYAFNCVRWLTLG